MNDNVAAVIVTRGDHDLTPIYHSIADAGIGLIKTWDNSKREQDLAVYGRYALIEETDEPLIYVQDDDVVLSGESIQALIETYQFIATCPHHGEMKYGSVKGHWGWVCWHDDHEKARFSPDALVANMPQPFRHDFYSDHCLVGFGAVFHRDLSERAFERFNVGITIPGVCPPHWSHLGMFDVANFRRTCDIVFTALTPRVLVDVPYENLPWAEDETRMYRSEGHVAERTRMLELVRRIR